MYVCIYILYITVSMLADIYIYIHRYAVLMLMKVGKSVQPQRKKTCKSL